MKEPTPNKPFDPEKEKDAYKKYKQSEKYIKYGGEDILVDYKDEINRDK